MKIRKVFSEFYAQWKANYKYNGGLKALLRCLFGLRLFLMPHRQTNNESKNIELLTFSVIPSLTSLWLEFSNKAIGNLLSGIVIGDCSSSFKPFSENSNLKIVPIYNLSHGVKLDLFLCKVCDSPYVLICDDDVFWLNAESLEWAIAELKSDPNIAAISLIPRSNVTRQMGGKAYPLMGTYCLIFRRDIWLKEKLSFKTSTSRVGNQLDFFDTADLANQLLIERGYKVLYASQESQDNFVRFEGTSSWLLKVRATNGHLSRVVKEEKLLREKVMRVLLSSQGMTAMINNHYQPGHDGLVNPNLLAIAIDEIKLLLPGSSVNEAALEVDRLLGLLQTTIGQ